MVRAAEPLILTENESYIPTKGFLIRNDEKRVQEAFRSLPRPEERSAHNKSAELLAPGFAEPAQFTVEAVPGGPDAKARTRRVTHHPSRSPSRPIMSELAQVTLFVTSEEKEIPTENETPRPNPFRPPPTGPPTPRLQDARQQAQPSPAAPRSRRTAGGPPGTSEAARTVPHRRVPALLAAGGQSPPRPAPRTKAAGGALTEADKEAEQPLLRAEVQRVPQHCPAAAALEHGAALQRQPLRRWAPGVARRRGWRRLHDTSGSSKTRRPLHSDRPAELRVLEQLPQPQAHRHFRPPACPASQLERLSQICVLLGKGYINPHRPRLLGGGPHRVIPSPNHAGEGRALPRQEGLSRLKTGRLGARSLLVVFVPLGRPLCLVQPMASRGGRVRTAGAGRARPLSARFEVSGWRQ